MRWGKLPARQFIEYIHSLGLQICRLLPRARVEIVEKGQSPTGFNQLLLTRTPEADIRAIGKAYRAWPRRIKRGVARGRTCWDGLADLVRGWRRL